MRLILSLFLLLAVIGCSSAPKTEESIPSAPSTPSSRPSRPSLPKVEVPEQEEDANIDEVGLQRSLGMDRPLRRLGFAEKTFNTCQAGYGYSSSHNCRRHNFIIVNFQLMCRDSEGTATNGVSHSEMEPIASRTVKWNLNGVNGSTETDSEGYAQVRLISSATGKKQRLKLGVGSEFLYMRTNEVDKIVTPKPWCSQ